MKRGAVLIIVAVFIICFGAFFRAQVPVKITEDEVFAAIDEATSETKIQVDEIELERAVKKSIQKLEARQKRRLKFLVSAYLVIWLIFSLYVLRISRTQALLHRRLEQLKDNLPP